MTRNEFELLKKNPYNSDLRQLFYIHCHELLNGGELRKTDAIYVEAWIKDKDNRNWMASAMSVAEQIFMRG